MKNENSNIFIGKRILIYGLGKSGLSSYKFLKKKNEIFLFDDNKKIILGRSEKKKLVSFNQIYQLKIDLIILSPGVDLKRCKLNNYLKSKKKKKFLLI